MKCVLALSFFLAAASAGAIHGIGVVPATGHVVSTPTSSQYHSQDVLGQYAYGYSGPLSSKEEVRTLDGITRGGYSYVDGHGLVQSAEYVSDPHNGFRVAATNLPVGPGVPAPEAHAAHVAAVAPAVAVAHSVAPAVANVAVAPAAYAVAPGLAHAAYAPAAVTSHSSVVTPDGIVSHAAVGPAVSHSTVVTHHGTSVVAPLAHALAHPVAHSYAHPLAHSYAHPLAHSYAHPYVLPYIHRRKRGLGLVAVGHTPASTAPLGHGIAIAAPAVHAYAAPAIHAYAAPAVHAYAAPAVSYSSAVVSHAVAPAVAVAAVAPVASSRYHAQDALGQYSYGYNDGVSAKEEVRTHDGVTRGAYSYVDPRGVLQSVHYAADGHGFRAAATNIL